MASYAKLRDGSWGIRVQGAAAPGETITVTKRSGETKQETVARVLWSGNGVSLCSIERDGGSRRGGYPYRGMGGNYCYYPCPVSGRKCCPQNGPCHDCE